MMQRVSATNARRKMGEVMSMVAGGDTVMIEKSGQPFAVVVPFQWYEEAVEADILLAIKAVRAAKADSRPTTG